MPRSSKLISIITLLLIIFSALSKPAAPVTAVESQTPTSPGTWSQAFAGPDKQDYGYAPIRPIEWNGTLYASLFGGYGWGSGVGYWSGQQWLKLDGLTGDVYSLTVHQNRLYVAGSFTIAGKNINLAYWDGNLWTAMPTRWNTGNQLQMVSHANQLYVGGFNLVIDGQAVGKIARWDGTQWHQVAAYVPGLVLGLLSRPDGLYVNGVFDLNGQINGLLRLNGSALEPVGGGIHGWVFDLKSFNNQLYVSGQFTSTLVPSMKNVAMWNGSDWETFGTGLNNETHNLTMFDGDLYALSQIGSGFQLQRWDANQWVSLANLTRLNNYPVWERFPDAVLVTYQQELLAFGPIQFFNTTPPDYRYGDSALRWQGDRWEAMTPNGTTAYEAAITTDADNLYVADNRMSWGNELANLAQLNASDQWQSLISGYSQSLSSVQALQKYQQHFFSISQYGLYQAATNDWNRVSNAHVNAIAQANNLLYVAGDFEQFNGVSAHNLVTWDGSQWQAFNPPASFDRVSIVEADTNYVYISDGLQLARWDGSQWTTLATNVINIGEVEPTANGVYIAGTFSSVGGVAAPKVAYWNGTTWSGVTGVVDGSINDLEMGADGLYVAGSFRGITNGIVSPGILRWDGTAWHGVGGGVQSGNVTQLAATSTRMFLHGPFNRVGNSYESSQIAAWEYGNEPLIKAKPDYAITYRPQAVTINVLANDWSDQPNRLQLVDVSSPSHGTAMINGNSVVYTPDPQFEGVETLSYVVRDPINLVTTTAQLRLQVWNHFPTIADQEQAIYPFVETLLDPLDGLIDLNDDALTLTQASAITGTVMLVNNQLRYLPPKQQHFTDVVTYSVSDGHGGQQTARIKLRSIDTIVTATADYATTYRPYSVSVDVIANDWTINGEPLAVVAVEAAIHGTATISGNQVRYLPTATFQGLKP
ncbi:Ig-like domain-containing protein [Herpetosiphon gulosus]|uniref:Cadherin-like domain-containing protein n=1 Tax=Herpetosiphon gulosus TaxID=1973496 RepID=A0ABP9WYG0_9CHLR